MRGPGTVSIRLGRVLALLGGLALVAAYPMPWFGVQVGNQGVLLSGQFLTRMLSGTSDLRRFLPGATGGPAEVQMLLALIYLFPGLGALAAICAASPGSGRRRTGVDLALMAIGAVALAALLIAIGRLPPNAEIDTGLWVMGAGAVAVIIGALLDIAARPPRL